MDGKVKKKFAVDAILAYVHCFTVAAESREDAEMVVERMIRNKDYDPHDFVQTEDLDVSCCGEENDEGEIEYD